jgi:hypothetical protein
VSSDLQKNLVESEAELLVSFVNTRDVEEETDSIADPDGLRDWIDGRTGEYLPEIDSQDLRRLLTLRESLRALLRANNGGEAG